jgi:hypothetical protein
VKEELKQRMDDENSSENKKMVRVVRLRMERGVAQQDTPTLPTAARCWA